MVEAIRKLSGFAILDFSYRRRCGAATSAEWTKNRDFFPITPGKRRFVELPYGPPRASVKWKESPLLKRSAGEKRERRRAVHSCTRRSDGRAVTRHGKPARCKREFSRIYARMRVRVTPRYPRVSDGEKGRTAPHRRQNPAGNRAPPAIWFHERERLSRKYCYGYHCLVEPRPLYFPAGSIPNALAVLVSALQVPSDLRHTFRTACWRSCSPWWPCSAAA
jgi:hypothetical protein